jgi:hypothetical protein
MPLMGGDAKLPRFAASAKWCAIFYPAGAQRVELRSVRQAAPLFSFLARYPKDWAQLRLYSAASRHRLRAAASF